MDRPLVSQETIDAVGRWQARRNAEYEAEQAAAEKKVAVTLLMRKHRCIYNTMCSCTDAGGARSFGTAQGYREHLYDVLVEAGYIT